MRSSTREDLAWTVKTAGAGATPRRRKGAAGGRTAGTHPVGKPSAENDSSISGSMGIAARGNATGRWHLVRHPHPFHPVDQHRGCQGSDCPCSVETGYVCGVHRRCQTPSTYLVEFSSPTGLYQSHCTPRWTSWCRPVSEPPAV